MHWSVGWSSRSCFPEWSRLRGEILRHLSHEADLEVPCRFHHCPCKASAIIEWVQITGPPSSLWWLTPPPCCCLTVGSWVPDPSSSFSPASMFCTSQSSAVLLLCCLFTFPLPVVCLVLSFSLKTRAWSCPPWQYSLNHVSCHWIRHSYREHTLRWLTMGSSKDQGPGSREKGSVHQGEHRLLHLFPGCEHLPELKLEVILPLNAVHAWWPDLFWQLSRALLYLTTFSARPQRLPLPQNLPGVVCVNPQASLGGFES